MIEILYKFARFAFVVYLKIFYKWEIDGSENIPDKGSVILAANHISNFDPIVVACSVKRPVRFMAKEELFKNRLFGKVLLRIGVFKVKRDKNDRNAIKKAISILKNNEVVGIFPEGTRSKNGELLKGLPGATYIAVKSQATVVPIGIISNYKLFNSVKIKIGKPFHLELNSDEKISSEKIVHLTENIMKQIKKQVDSINENHAKQ